MQDTVEGFLVVPRVQRERAFGAHLALLVLRDLLVLAMRGVRDPQDLQDHQDLPRSLVLIGRVSRRMGSGPGFLRVTHGARSSQLYLSCSCQCSWSARPSGPSGSPWSHGCLCWGKCSIGQGLRVWIRTGEVGGISGSPPHQSTGCRDQCLGSWGPQGTHFYNLYSFLGR